MKTYRRSVLAASLLLGVAAAGSAFAQAPAPGFDAAAAWQRFLAEGDVAKAYGGYDVLQAVSYDEHAVDAAACATHRDELARAVEAAPVGIALRHAALLCAQAGGDAAAVAREEAALDALAALALSQAKDSDATVAPPIRVLTGQDAGSLLAVAGLEPQYEYYAGIRPTRYMPYVKVVADGADAHERHLAFDMVDAMDAIIHNDPYSGYPMQRVQLAEQLTSEEAAVGLTRAQDVRAVLTATTKDDVAAKVAALRDAAADGGIQSLASWTFLCQQKPTKGCADGLVDSLLPLAEQRQALPMALLAYAYANGIGIDKDEKAARTLMDAADARWPEASASTAVLNLWAAVDGGQMPAFVRERADRAVAAGNRLAILLVSAQAIDAGDALDEARRGQLARPEYNWRGAGYALLARDALQHERTAEAVDWTRKAAEAGNGWAAEQYGWRLRFGRDVGRDREAAERWLRAAAHESRPFAARLLAGDAIDAGQWDVASNWLIAPASVGNVDALLDFAALNASGRLGKEKVAEGISLYRQLADGDIPEARRRLAMRAISGDGIDKSPAQAEAWLRKDAENGDHASEALLGSGYLRGEFGKVDEAEGMRWTERALAAKEPGAFVDYGAWLYYTKNTPESRRKALGVWEQGADAGAAIATNNLAWARCTAPHDDIREPKAGLEASARIGDIDDLDAGTLDTVAACHAATGDYAGAVQMQKRALEMFRKAAEGSDEARTEMAATLDRAGKRLALYEAGKPYTELDSDRE
jgi:TPR repeat protein